MRPIFWLCVFMACAGSAQACGELHSAALRTERGTTEHIAGGVWLAPRPMPGTQPWMPDLSSPVVGPHGGQLAVAHPHDKAG